MRAKLAAIAATTILALMAGCATHRPAPVAPPPPAGAYGVQYGVVHSIDTVRAQSQTSGAGAVVGGVVGGVVGRQFGSRGGRDAMTAVGVVAGAIVGNEIEKNQRGANDVYRVTVRVEQGGLRAFDYQSLNDLRVGDRVRIENNQLYRW